MNPLLTIADVLVLTVSALAVLTGRRRRWGWVLLVASGLWLPLNNRILEGPILLTVTSTHGLTASDLIGIAGAFVAGLRLFPPQRGRDARWFVLRWGLVAAVVVAGFVAAALVTDVEFVGVARSAAIAVREPELTPTMPEHSRGKLVA